MNYNERTVLVTGAAGFLGSAIVNRLENAHWNVKCTDIASHTSNLFNYVVADITDSTAVRPLLRGVDTVVHAAGLAHQFRISPEVVKSLFSINVTGTENMVLAAVAAGVRHFILISSVSVYGRHDSVGCNETTPCQPADPYAQSKREAELALIRYAQSSAMRVTILRLATVYGEGDRGNMARLMKLIDSGHFVWIGRGNNKKTLIFRDDVAQACQLALESQGDEKLQIYNVVSSSYTMQEIVTEMASALHCPVPRWRLPARLTCCLTGLASYVFGKRGRIASLHSSITKWLSDDVYDGNLFRNNLGFRPEISLAEGFQREVAWYRSVAKETI